MWVLKFNKQMCEVGCGSSSVPQAQYHVNITLLANQKYLIYLMVVIDISGYWNLQHLETYSIFFNWLIYWYLLKFWSNGCLSWIVLLKEEHVLDLQALFCSRFLHFSRRPLERAKNKVLLQNPAQFSKVVWRTGTECGTLLCP